MWNGIGKRLRGAAPRAYPRHRLAILKARAEAGSDHLLYTMIAPTSEGAPCRARLVDIYARPPEEGEEEGEEGMATEGVRERGANESARPLSGGGGGVPSAEGTAAEEEEEEEEDGSSAVRPLEVEFEALMDWDQTSHMARLREPFRKGSRIGDFVSKWTPYHQGKIDDVFGFLEVKPEIKQLPSGIFTVVLPPGCSVYADDMLFWAMIGFDVTKVGRFNLDWGRGYGFRNVEQRTIYLSGEQRLPSSEVENYLVGPRAQLGVSRGANASKEVKVMFIMEKNVKKTFNITSPSGNLHEVARLLVTGLLEDLNLGHLYLVESQEEDGSVLIQTKRVRDTGIQLHLEASPDTAATLGMRQAIVILHFDTEDDPGLDTSLRLSRKDGDKAVEEAAAAAAATAAAAELETEEALVGEDAGEEEEEEEEEEEPAAVGAADATAKEGWKYARLLLNKIAPFTVVMLGARGSSYVHDQGTMNVVGYYSSRRRLLPVEIFLAGDETVLILKFLASNLAPYIFEESVSIYVVFEIETVQY